MSADPVRGLAPDVRGRLVTTIKAALQEWLREGRASDGQQINSGAARGGCCSDFAGAVLQELGGPKAADQMGVDVLGIDSFQVVEDADSDDRPLDRALLSRHWPLVVPPNELTWDDLDRLAEAAGWNSGTHVWLSFGGLHFDAETPEGVENFFDLPFFRRVVAAWIAETGVVPNVRR